MKHFIFILIVAYLVGGGIAANVDLAFGQSAVKLPKGIVGSTTAAEVGQTGEFVFASNTSGTTASTPDTDVDVAGLSISLTPGRWLIGYDVSVSVSNTTGTESRLARTRITADDNTPVVGSEAIVRSPPIASDASIATSMSRVAVVYVTATTIYKVRLACSTSGSATVYAAGITSAFTNPDNSSNIWALRI